MLEVDDPASAPAPSRAPGAGNSNPLSSLAAWVGALTGWRRALAAVTAGALSALAMAPFFLWPVLAFTLPMLLWLLPMRASQGPAPNWRRRARSGAWVGWCFGFGYHLAGLYWIGFAFLVEADKFAALLPFAVMAMPAGLALFLALATGAVALTSERAPVRIASLALAFSASEWLRGHVFTGFPWNVIGYALTEPLVLAQTAGLIGIYGLTLVAVLALATPLAIWAEPARVLPAPVRRRASPRRLIALVLPLAILAAMTAYGSWRLSLPVPADVAGVKVRIVQPSVAQSDKWRQDKQREIFETHLATSTLDARGQPDGLAGITHVIWPEAAMPFLPLRHPEALAAIGNMLPDGVVLIAGALRLEMAETPRGPVRRAFNSAMVFSSDGGLAGLYDKIHLVPFGEYLPFQETLESIGLEQLSRMKGGFAAGPAPRPLMRIAGLPPVSLLICYESSFPGAVIQGHERPAAFLNVTNDGWFGTSTGPYQHLRQTRLRAIEEGIPVLRVANNGVSAVFDAFGRERGRIELDVRGVLDTPLPGVAPPPLYASARDLTFWLLWVLLTIATLFGAVRAKS